MTLVLFLSFLLLLMVGVPVAFSLGISSLIYLFMADIPLIVIPQKMFAGLDSFVLLCVPGFILAGNLMNNGGITNKIVDLSNALVGRIRGGLGLANVVTSMVFAGISGTAVSDAASVGSIMIPAMKKQGYDLDQSCGLTAAASTVGPIIPPSVPMIIAGTLTGLSVGKLFVAGAIPGILMGLGFMGLWYYMSVKNNYPKGRKYSLPEIGKSFIGAFWAILMTAIIFVGIVGGIFTPTEAAFVAVVYGLVVGLFVYKELKLKDIPKIVIESAVQSAGIMLLVGFANIFAWIMASEQIPQAIAGFMLGITHNKYLMLLLINLLLLFVGAFMETIAALVILFPTLLQVATSVGVDPIQFAIIAVLNLVIGLTTPPVGVCLYVAGGIGKISLGRMSKAIVPFLGVSLAVLALVTYVPQISLFLVHYMAK
ncbi:TRAP transporter large permease [Paradesulfitobacterium ferrireducens]|uniref:TRAP transporter large permease n=1 Tax=Paradesulfitobacterium ferrireducens TaxID=2816476 RepID=UPI001A8BF5E2|nr:TRAP transporter large permease [Paradesulfitobacterium ferrireducens]